MKILFPLIRWDLESSAGRLLDLGGRMGRAGIEVDFITTSDDLAERIRSRCPGRPVHLAERQRVMISWDFRDELARPYIRKTYDLSVPGTDLPFWKVTAFDDFRGHVSNVAFRIPPLACDAVVLPLPSTEDGHPDVEAIFFTRLFSEARIAGIPIVFFLLYPVVAAPRLFLRFGDLYIVRDEFESSFLEWAGVPPEKIDRIEHPVERYFLDVVADPYMDGFLKDPDFPLPEARPAVTVVNHPKHRPQVREILRLLARSPRKPLVYLVRRNYTVRSLTEEEILGEILEQETRGSGAEFRRVDAPNLHRAVLASDIVLAPFFLTAMPFARRYGRATIIHNPRFTDMPLPEGIRVTSTEEELGRSLEALLAHPPRRSFAEILKGLEGASRSGSRRHRDAGKKAESGRRRAPGGRTASAAGARGGGA